jgi:hypothetical protein
MARLANGSGAAKLKGRIVRLNLDLVRVAGRVQGNG